MINYRCCIGIYTFFICWSIPMNRLDTSTIDTVPSANTPQYPAKIVSVWSTVLVICWYCGNDKTYPKVGRFLGSFGRFFILAFLKLVLILATVILDRASTENNPLRHTHKKKYFRTCYHVNIMFKVHERVRNERLTVDPPHEQFGKTVWYLLS